MSGGNDGLNTVVPYADDAYARSRTTLRLTAGEVHKIDSQLGFHPQMPTFARVFAAGQLCGAAARDIDIHRGIRR